MSDLEIVAISLNLKKLDDLWNKTYFSQAKTEHLHKWEMKTKLMLEEKEREVHEGKRVLAHTEEQLNRKTAEIARLKENYKQVRLFTLGHSL